jgi:hypothetical protein
MKNIDKILELCKEYFNAENLKQNEEVFDGKDAYSLVLEKVGDTINISLTKKENVDQKNFEAFVDSIDDDLWLSVTENFKKLTGTSLQEIENMLNEGSFKKVLYIIKPAVKQTASDRIAELQKEIDSLKDAYQL